MKFLPIVIVALISKTCIAGNADIIERSLTADAKMQNRLLDGDVVVSKLSKAGMFRNKPSERQDYSDFYVPQKPLYVLGAKLISFEHEYLQKYIGCCVNPGNSVVLLPTGNTTAIESFAKKNKCKLSVGDQIFLVPKSALKGLSEEERKSLVEVSCKDNYLSE